MLPIWVYGARRPYLTETNPAASAQQNYGEDHEDVGHDCRVDFEDRSDVTIGRSSSARSIVSDEFRIPRQKNLGFLVARKSGHVKWHNAGEPPGWRGVSAPIVIGY